MKKGLKALLLVMCAIVLVCATVFATLAYMTSQGTVTNTFTYGNVTIVLDEATVGTDGKAIDKDNARQTENTYKLIAGKDYDKDPTVKVDADSDDSYLFIKYEIHEDVEAAVDIQNWNASLVAVDEENYPGLFVYKTAGEANEATIVKANDKIVVFDGFTVDEGTTNSVLSKVDTEDKIVVQAFAIQADEINYTTAKNEAISLFFPTQG